MRILLVEDNADLAANVGEYLSARGHAVDYAHDGLSGLHLCATGGYDAIVLDLMLPGVDGITLCRRVRAEAADPTPILMLTARDTLDDKVAGLEAGADDYLVKPFELRELAARLDAITRRGRPPGRRLRVADLVLDLDTLRVERAGRELTLTPSALKLLEVLMKAAPAVVSRDVLERALWGDSPPMSDALRLHVHVLRRAIDRGFDHALLRTVRGRGLALSSGPVDAP